VHLDQSGLELPDELEETDEEDDGAVEVEREAEARVLGVGETEVLLLAGGEGDAEEESDGGEVAPRFLFLEPEDAPVDFGFDDMNTSA